MSGVGSLQQIDVPSFEDVGEARTFPVAFWLLMAAAGLAFVVAVASGWSEAETMVLVLMLAIPVGFVARGLPIAADAHWLPNMLILGYVAKLGASSVRYWALEFLYNGVGDATGYHNHGIQLSPVWRSFQVPPFEPGTEFVQVATGFIYVPHVPTKLGGFLIFATLAFLGQILLYAAFRRALPSPRLKWYALLIFFFPNIVYWPSSIGKESLMILFIGMAAYGAARLFASYEIRWMLILGIGLLGCAAIRSHIALLLAVSLAAAMVLGRAPVTDHAKARRLAHLLVVGVVLVGVARFANDDFGIDLSGGINETFLEEEIDPIFAGVEEQTSRGGSAVEGTAISSPLDVPEAVLRVIFRPLPTDAHNVQALVNSVLEGSLLLTLFIWRLPAILRNLPRMWRSPYLIFSFVYTAGFIFGHSAILNLGIVARQRSQLIPFVLVLLVELGARARPAAEPMVVQTKPIAKPLAASVR